MRRAAFLAMFLTQIRDRGALAMGFVLPALVYLIFAVIFVGAAGGTLDLRVAIADVEQSDASERFLKALLEDDQIRRLETEQALTPDDVRALVKEGRADVGLVIGESGRALAGTEPDDPRAAPVILVTEPTRAIAASVVEGLVQNAYFESLPHVVIRSVADLLTREFLALSPEQTARLDAGLKAMATTRDGTGEGETAAKTTELPFAGISARQSGVAASSVPVNVSYYAGAVAIMFLLFSSLNGASTLLEEREAGLLERLSVGPSGARALVDGKFVYLVGQGFLQASIIFLIAWLGFGLDLPAHLGPWAITTALAAWASAGLLLWFVSLCRTRAQAQTLGNILILVVSAIGGSMVPRFFMPENIQAVGWATPNTWALEAYAAIFWRGETTDAMLIPWAALGVAGLVGLILAHVTMARNG